MTPSPTIPPIRHVALCGLGAVGTMLAARILPRIRPGESFRVLLDPPRLPRYRLAPPTFNGAPLHLDFATPADAPSAPPPDLFLLAVKNRDLPSAIPLLRPFFSPPARILPLLNGLDAVPALSAAFPPDSVLRGLVFCNSSMRSERDVVQRGALEIRFGEASNVPPSPPVLRIADWLSAHDVPNAVPPDMTAALWRKFLLNVALNQAEALTRLPHGPLLASPPAMDLLRNLLAEAAAVAAAENVPGAADLPRLVLSDLSALTPDGRTSMLQDVEAGRTPEVDAFAGAILRLAQKHGIPAPANALALGLLSPHPPR